MSTGNLQYQFLIASASFDVRCIQHSPFVPSRLLSTGMGQEFTHRIFAAIADFVSKPIYQPTDVQKEAGLQLQIDTLDYEERLDMKKRTHGELAKDPMWDWCENDLPPIFDFSSIIPQKFLQQKNKSFEAFSKLFPSLNFLAFHT